MTQRALFVSHDAGGNEVPLFPAWINTLTAGDLRVENLQGVVIELPPNLRVGGIVAPQRAFAGALVEIDFRALKVRVDRGGSGEIDHMQTSDLEVRARAPARLV